MPSSGKTTLARRLAPSLGLPLIDKDAILKNLFDFWRLPGMPSDSGTPTGWLTELASRVVHVHCACAPEVAGQRFFQRNRHPGHLDGESSHAEALESLRAVSRLGVLEIGPRVTVDTSHEPDLAAVLREIQQALAT